MKPALPRFALAALMAAPFLVACGGDEGGAVETNCEIKVTPGNVALGTLCLDAESQQTFNVENVGSAECLVDLSLTGLAPQYFAISSSHLVVPTSSSQPVTVTYHPSSEVGAVPGEQHFARVALSWTGKDAAAETFEVALDGETAATETKAILSLSCPPSVKACNDPNRDPSEACCRVTDLNGPTTMGPPYYGRSYLTSVEFGQVQAGRTMTVPLTVTNLGCGELNLSDLAINATGGSEQFCPPESVRVVTPLPVSVPGSVSSQTRQSKTVEIEFHPTSLCTYFAGVTVTSNDPDVSATDPITSLYGKFNLQGAGTAGQIRTDPTAWYFGDVGVGETVERTFTIVNIGTRAVDVSSVLLRNGEGAYQITKIERPNCPAGSSYTPLGATFSLAATDGAAGSNCGEDQANITVTFSPTDAGSFENYLDVDYGDGIATIPLTGGSAPKIEVFPPGRVMYYGPKILGCQPLSCTVDGEQNQSCAGACENDGDCRNGAMCLGGVCASESSADNGAACAETCGIAQRTVKICNVGHAPLKFDDAAQGGGLVITGNGGHDHLPPMHLPSAGIDDPARDHTPVFTVTDNDCADTAGNGITLPAPSVDGAIEETSCCEAKVGFLDTRNGGFIGAELHVYSNDPTYPRDLADGVGVELLASTDADFDPVAKWEAYDLVQGPGPMNGPKMGRMAVLDASKSVDPTCDWSDPGCDQTRVNPIVSFEWELVAVSGIGDYVNAMVGPIDLANPNARCPTFINGGNCFEVVDLGSQRGKVIHFFPDAEYARNYEFKLTVTDGVCSPSHQGVLQETVQVGAGG